MEKICKNCLYFNKEKSICNITIIHEGEYYELPVLPTNECYWLKLENELSQKFDEKFELKINEVKKWFDGKNIHVESP